MFLRTRDLRIASAETNGRIFCLINRVTRNEHFEPLYSVNWHFWKLLAIMALALFETLGLFH